MAEAGTAFLGVVQVFTWVSLMPTHSKPGGRSVPRGPTGPLDLPVCGLIDYNHVVTHIIHPMRERGGRARLGTTRRVRCRSSSGQVVGLGQPRSQVYCYHYY